MPPLISIIIPAYNIETYLPKALDSVLAQSFGEYEVIVVDDGSTDATAAVVTGYKDPRIRCVQQENRGLSGARNTGIRLATGEWIALLDGDDEWFPDKLARQMACLRDNPGLVWCCCNHLIRNLATGAERLMKPARYCDRFLQGRDWFGSFFQANLSGIWWPPSTMVVRRDVFDAVGLFREGLRFAEDIEMWWRIAYRWPRLGFISEPLVCYHEFRPDSLMTATHSHEKIRAMCDIFDEHLETSHQYHCYEGVRGFVDNNIRRFIETCYLEGDRRMIGLLLARYRRVLPWRYRWGMALFTRLVRPDTVFSRKCLNKFNWLDRPRGIDCES